MRPSVVHWVILLIGMSEEAVSDPWMTVVRVKLYGGK
jgi:hypothetical protein